VDLRCSEAIAPNRPYWRAPRQCEAHGLPWVICCGQRPRQTSQVYRHSESAGDFELLQLRGPSAIWLRVPWAQPALDGYILAERGQALTCETATLGGTSNQQI
jgi:hypothetical protein